jgi:hypothetical protein
MAVLASRDERPPGLYTANNRRQTMFYAAEKQFGACQNLTSTVQDMTEVCARKDKLANAHLYPEVWDGSRI